MTIKPFFIGPIKEGLERNMEPFMLPNDAFPELTDCYLYKGRITKRIGNQNITNDYPTFTGIYAAALIAGEITYTNTFVNTPITPFMVIIDVIERLAAGPVDTLTFVDDGLGNMLLWGFPAGTINYATGVFVINFPALLPTLGFYDVLYRYNSSIAFATGRLVQEIRLRDLGNTVAAPGTLTTVVVWGIGEGIQPGSCTLNVGLTVYNETVPPNGILTAPGNYRATLDYTSGLLTIQHTAAGAEAITLTFSYYPGRPVMGLKTQELETVNRENLIAFDTNKANLFNVAGDRFQDISYDTVAPVPNVISWTGTDINFFWTTNFAREETSNNKLFWATNNIENTTVAGEVRNGIQIYNGVGWALQTPPLTLGGWGVATRYLVGCLLLVPYKSRMVALNTLESTLSVGGVVTRYSNRARWSSPVIRPYTNSQAQINALVGPTLNSWDDTTPGNGNYVDAPTAEQIISCEFFKDILIVFFERSTWALLYTGNSTRPFTWKRINTQFGSESPFSVVGFDKGIFAVGDKAIVIADSTNVERIDQKIPEEVFDFHNQSDGPKRVYGIRNYYFQFVYWTFPNVYTEEGKQGGGGFPNRVLVMNYLEGSYSFYKDSYTCFGNYQSSADRTWANSDETWETMFGSWNSGYAQADFPSVIAGNQEGFVMIVDESSPNGKTLFINNISQANQPVITCPDHNLESGQFIVVSDAQGMTQINGLTGKVVDVLGTFQFTINLYDAAGTLLLTGSTGFDAYVRSGFITVINNIEIVTKKFNPFFQDGQKTRMNYLDIFVQRTDSGQFQVDFLVDDSTSQPITTETVYTTQTYGPAVGVEKMWQRIYTDIQGQFLQFKIYMNDQAMLNEEIRNSNIVIHGMLPWMRPNGRLFSYDMPRPLP